LAEGSLHYKTYSIPFAYQGLPNGANPRRENTWRPLSSRFPIDLGHGSTRLWNMVLINSYKVWIESGFDQFNFELDPHFHFSFMKLLIKVLLGCCVGWVYFAEGEILEAFHISAQQSCSVGSLGAWEG